MNDLIPQDNDFSRALATPARGNSAMNIGTVTIESERAIAEVRSQIQLAKMFPRSKSGAMTEFLETCASPEFAAVAFYSVPNRGSGPSIRFAEELARCYGNFEFGHIELSRGNGKSEVQVYAWDKERNNRSPRQITVEHVIDTKNGPKPCRDQTDIDNLIANKAAKVMRGRILAITPKDMVQAGIDACKRTLAGGSDKPIGQRIMAMAAAFSKFGVTNKLLEKHLGHVVDDTTIDELADLMGIYNALKEGGKASEYFPSDATAEPAEAAKAITEAAKKPAAAKKATTSAGALTPGSVPAANAEPVSKTVKDQPPVEAAKKAPEAEPAEAPSEASEDDVNAAISNAADEEGDVF